MIIYSAVYGVRMCVRMCQVGTCSPVEIIEFGDLGLICELCHQVQYIKWVCVLVGTGNNVVVVVVVTDVSVTSSFVLLYSKCYRH